MSVTRRTMHSLRAVLLASTGSLMVSVAAAQAPGCPPANRRPRPITGRDGRSSG